MFLAHCWQRKLQSGGGGNADKPACARWSNGCRETPAHARAPEHRERAEHFAVEVKHGECVAGAGGLKPPAPAKPGHEWLVHDRGWAAKVQSHKLGRQPRTGQTR
jgi:hypothetical protein